MSSILHRIPAFALPFVTRSLRGGRGRRFVALSFGLAALVLLSCLWIGLGRGAAAREARVEIGMEAPIYLREHHEFVVIRNPEFDRDESIAARQAAFAEDARATVRAAAEQYPVGHDDLHEQARAMAQSWGAGPPSNGYFSWHDPVSVHRLTKMIEREGVPAIVDYTPMVDLRGTLQLLAMVCGGLLIVLFTVVAPLLVGLQQATERNENTLQPLTGTALGARELAVGLACGPLAIVAIFAAPIAALYVFAAAGIGASQSLILLPMLMGTAIGLVFGAQLLAQLIGSRRAPGLIAVGLLVMLGLVALAGLGLAVALEHSTLGFASVIPHAGMLGVLGEHFSDPWRNASLPGVFVRPRPGLGEFLAPTLVGTIGAALLGLLALHALTRQIEGRATLLEFGHALFGALVCIVMVDVAIPSIDHEPLHQVLGLPALALPFLLLIMARVPVGDVPTKLRRIPLTRLLAEFACWTLLHLTLAATLDGSAVVFHPVTLIATGWCVLVIVLLAARIAATPGQLLAHAWVLVCLGMLPFTYAFGCAWAFDPNAHLDMPPEIPAVALPWLVLLIWVPISLLRHLRKHVARLA